MRKWNGYQSGINFGGWYSQCDYSKERYDNFIQKEDVANVATWGLDHVRVPVDYNLVEDEQGNYIEEGFIRIQKIIDWCGEYGLNMILDLHKTAGYSFDVKENESGFFSDENLQERFYKLWEEFAKRFGKNKDRMAFELLNEVEKEEYMPAWNRISDTCIKRIRKIVPDIDILVGGYWNNSVRAIKSINMPQDAHIIYNFHCYDPLIFTHQGAYWVAGMPQDYRFPFDQSYTVYQEETRKILGNLFEDYPELPSPEQTLDSKFFRILFAEAVETAEKRNVPLYCGEYGVIDQAKPEDAVKWYKAIHEVLEENGIGRAAWTYREMDFGFVDAHFAGVLEEIKKLM